ncbi:ran-binding protein 3-like isoform X2 [Rhineura floridana]|uniref:ran-binding protein 3-like isoform X2 n=1 Tax=Rhineura floridana TaxID=261503 RepID=UPI002AC7F684|nr:ran-binding protein 3-like isoform X2 [Rhineura floridana]
MKGQLHFIEKRDSSDTWTMNQTADTTTSVYMFHRLGNSKHNDEDDEERSVIAQPVFVFKKERPYKRPAEDPVCKIENVSVGYSRKRARSLSFSFQTSDSQSYREIVLSHKRVRSSSFTILPTFPPSQPVKKNNIFMTSALLQKSISANATEKGLPSTNVQQDVLKPAILQPPQVPLCTPEKKTGTENILENNREPETEVSGVPYFWADDSGKPFLSLHISGLKTMGNQLPEGRTFSNSRHSDFVFGENIVERVLRPEKSPDLHSENKPHNERESTFPTGFHARSPWTTSFFAKDTTLVESAAAYVSSKATQRYLLDKVEVTTGEEAEHNVLQINCRLFLFNKASLSWTERGSGSLRLNDTSSNQCGMLQSRLIMRNQGSMRLILNTKLWTQMVIERANRKSLCITASDLEDCSVKVFLIQASSKDAASLYAAIHHRLVALKSFADQECEVDPESDIQTLNCDSDDEENEKVTQVSNNKSGSLCGGCCCCCGFPSCSCSASPHSGSGGLGGPSMGLKGLAELLEADGVLPVAQVGLQPAHQGGMVPGEEWLGQGHFA